MSLRATVQDIKAAILALSKEKQAQLANELLQQPGNVVYVLGQVIDQFEEGQELAHTKLKAYARKPVKMERGQEIDRLFRKEGLRRADGKPDFRRIRERLAQDGRASVSPRIKKTNKLVSLKTLQNDWLRYLRSRQGPPNP